MPKKRSRKNIIVIKNKGDLTKYGYKNVRKLSRKKRHESLDKAVKQYGRTFEFISKSLKDFF